MNAEQRRRNPTPRQTRTHWCIDHCLGRDLLEIRVAQQKPLRLKHCEANQRREERKGTGCNPRETCRRP